MDGERIRNYLQQETLSMLEVYKNFEILIPSTKGNGSDHKAEDGRFVENLIRSLLIKFLPKELEVLTGFIVRPAVKVGKNDRSRDGEKDDHSTQLDIIVYNSAHYPVYLRSNDTVIVPPEGVICIISVKKTLNGNDIKKELEALKDVSKLCRCKNLRGPYLALVSMDCKIYKKRTDTFDWIFNEMKSVYKNNEDLEFDDMVGFIGAFKQWGIFKKSPDKNPKTARFVSFEYNETDSYLGLQFLLTGILSVYYDDSRSSLGRPGFTSFPNSMPSPKNLGTIPLKTSKQVE